MVYPNSHVILIGFMGAGKTSVGQILASHWNFTCFDLDDEIASRYGQSVSDIIHNKGISYFRDIEYSCFKGLLKLKRPAVISTGGGIVETKLARDVLVELMDVIWLKVSLNTVKHRLSSSAKNQRPLFDDNVDSRFQFRQDMYNHCSNSLVQVDNLSIAEVAESIINGYG